MERFTASPASAEATKSQKPQRFHLKSATAEITFTRPASARAQNAQSGVFAPFRRNHSDPNTYISAIAEFTMITKTRYVVRHPCRSLGFEAALGLSIIGGKWFASNENKISDPAGAGFAPSPG